MTGMQLMLMRSRDTVPCAQARNKKVHCDRARCCMPSSLACTAPFTFTQVNGIRASFLP